MCPSGGALGVGNPIAATGLMKIAELYFQLSGQAGERQVKRTAHRGIAQAWGDLMQVGTVVVMSCEGAASPARTSRWSQMKAEDLPGTALKDVDGGPARHVHAGPPLRLGQRLRPHHLPRGLPAREDPRPRTAAHCGRMMIPARAFCEVCNLHEVNDFYDLPDTGTVMTYTLSHVDWDSSPLPEGQGEHLRGDRHRRREPGHGSGAPAGGRRPQGRQDRHAGEGGVEARGGADRATSWTSSTSGR